MKRRRYLVGVGTAVAGGSALVGSGAFSRVESQRHVTVETAHDRDAYLELNTVSGSANSQNFVGFDDGHLEIDLRFGSQDGDGVNSDSRTWFDDLFKICNRGKETATVYVEEQTGVGDGPSEIGFYTGTASGSQGDGGVDLIVGQDDEIEIEVGHCQNIGIRTNTEDVSAYDDELFEDYVTIVADSPDAGDPDA